MFSYWDVLRDICTDSHIQLLRYDYNESQKGKDEADRISAVLKRYMRWYVENGNDIITAVDLKNAFLYHEGPPNIKIGIIKQDAESEFYPKRIIKDIKSMHSIVFKEKNITLHRYFEIGAGSEIIPLTTHFESKAQLVSPYEGKMNAFVNCNELAPVLFCSEQNCSEIFDSNEDLEQHLTENQHTPIKILTAWDEVKSMYLDLSRGKDSDYSSEIFQ